MKGQWNDKIFNVASGEFASLALEAFQFQYARIPIYKSFADRLGYHPDNIQAIEQIPFLPIRFFKSHIVQSTGEPAKLIFESSGTTQGSASRHFVTDPNVYIESFTQCFKRFYGDPSEWCILGLLPSYLERTNSSLVFMVNELIKQSGHDRSGFYLDEFAEVAAKNAITGRKLWASRFRRLPNTQRSAATSTTVNCDGDRRHEGQEGRTGAGGIASKIDTGIWCESGPFRIRHDGIIVTGLFKR
jgi:hypothetical protein